MQCPFCKDGEINDLSVEQLKPIIEKALVAVSNQEKVRAAEQLFELTYGGYLARFRRRMRFFSVLLSLLVSLVIAHGTRDSSGIIGSYVFPMVVFLIIFTTGCKIKFLSKEERKMRENFEPLRQVLQTN